MVEFQQIMKKKIKRGKILIISSQRPYNGGMSTTAYNLRKVLNNDFEVYSLFFNTENQNADPDKIGRVFQMSYRDSNYLKKLLLLFGIKAQHIESIIFKYCILKLMWQSGLRPDLIITNVPDFILKVNSLFKRVKKIFIVNGCSPLEMVCSEQRDFSSILNSSNYSDILEKIAFLKFNQLNNASVIFNSEITKQLFYHLGIYNGSSKAHFFNIIPQNLIVRKTFDQRKYDIGFVVSNQSRNVKNVKLAKTIFGRFPNNPKIVIGAGVNLFSNLPNTECYHSLSQNQVMEFLNDVRVLIVTSYFDSSPGIQAEAIYMGANVLTSRNVGWNSLFDANCVVENYFNLEEWVQKISYLKNHYCENDGFKKVTTEATESIVGTIKNIYNKM